MVLTENRPFTHSGSDEAERRVKCVVNEVAEIVGQIIPPQYVLALVLIGGYGRGEGGVRTNAGRQVPNNNLDFLLIGRNQCRRQFSGWQQLADRRLERLQHNYDIGIDLSIISGRTLRRAPCRIMWYDMKGGHRTILGDAEFVPSLNRFRLDRIPAWDVHNLIVNRGTLLLINDCLPDLKDDESLQRIRLRHRAKAVIGYGDALLFCHGQYHWSYARKQKRMQSLEMIPSSFRQLYAEASDFRFHPDKIAGNLLSSGRTVRQLCEVAHRKFESHRLKQTLDSWEPYLETALRNGWREDAGSITGWLRNFRNMIRNRADESLGHDWKSNLGQRLIAPQRMLGLLSPAVLYQDCPPLLRQTAATWLGTESTERTCLTNAYLRHWGQVVDRNFFRAWRRVNISYAPTE